MRRLLLCAGLFSLGLSDVNAHNTPRAHTHTHMHMQPHAQWDGTDSAYLFVSEQFRSMRQDMTVQSIKVRVFFLRVS